MRRSLTSFGVVVAGLLTAGVCAAQQQPSASSEISASGLAEIHLLPDRAALTITAETRDRLATPAMATNTRIVSGIVAALRRAGVPSSAITTSDVSVDQYFPPRYDPREAPLPDGIVVRTTVRVETEGISTVSQLVDSAVAAGATRVGVQYSSSKMSEARRGAISTAFAGAHADAVALAQAAGGTLGRLLSAGPNGASPAVQLRGVSTTGSVYYGGNVLTSGPSLPPPSVGSTVVVSARWEFVSGSK